MTKSTTLHVTLDRAPYIRSHGLRPRGQGHWWFKVEGVGELCFSGTFAESSYAVVNHIRNLGRTGWVVVEVLP